MKRPCKTCWAEFEAKRGSHGACSPQCRFASKIGYGDGCWEWAGYIDAAGYGRIGRLATGEPMEFAHRAAYRYEHGAIPAERIVCHQCNNRRCVRPSHLYAGTYATNAADAIRAGTFSALRQNRKVSIV